jgi:hypothetical protein
MIYELLVVMPELYIVQLTKSILYQCKVASFIENRSVSFAF